MKRFTALTAGLLAAGTLLAGTSAVAAPSSAKGTLDSYCSSTGDYCLAIVAQRKKVKFQISSPSLSGGYTLCVRGPQSKQCRNYTLSSDDGNGYFDEVGLMSQFGYQGTGIYRATWKIGGQALKKTLAFQY